MMVFDIYLPFLQRLETHLMMSLCYGKVTADTARLALATQVVQVNHIPTIYLLYYYYYSQWKYFQSRIYQVIAVLLIC